MGPEGDGDVKGVLGGMTVVRKYFLQLLDSVRYQNGHKGGQGKWLQ